MYTFLLLELYLHLEEKAEQSLQVIHNFFATQLGFSIDSVNESDWNL
jgi:hypothetical protein